MPKHPFFRFIFEFYSHWEAAWLGTVSLLVAICLWAAGAKELSWGGFAVAAFLCFVVAAFQTWNKQEHRIENLNHKLTAVPKIKLAREGIQSKMKDFEILSDDGELERVRLASCLTVYFQNDPDFPAPTAIAPDVIAFIDFYNADAHPEHLFQVTGRWADSDQPVGRPPTSSLADLHLAQFGIGQKRELDIAVKYYDAPFCYAVCNEDLRSGTLQPLSGKEIMAKVRLRGTHIDKTWTVRFKNKGSNSPLEPLECIGS